jgi:hypothetical protein
MRQIDDPSLRIDIEDHALHAGDEVIAIAKIGQQCNERNGRRHLREALIIIR